MIYSLMICLSVGATAGYLGSLMITKRTALLGDALGHVALPGIAIALIYSFDLSLGALMALTIGILLIWLFEQKSKLHFEALTGVVFTFSVALAFVLLPEKEIHTALVGDLSKAQLLDVCISIVVCMAIIFTVSKIYNKLILMSLSEYLARIEHVNIRQCNFIFLVCIALVVALGIKVTGSLLIGALVVTPAAAAKNISYNLTQYSLLSSIFGIISCVLGLIISTIISFPSGPVIIFVSSLIFFITLYVKKV